LRRSALHDGIFNVTKALMRALASVLLCLTLAGHAHAAALDDKGQADARQHQLDVAAINQVVEQFKGAIVAHDGDALASLFLQDHDSWLSVADEATFSAARARNPAAPKVTPSTFKEFAAFIKNSPKSIEERFYRVRIDTNGAVGSVWFDFDFLIDGKVTNRGSESWQMVRAPDGWKISSMLYSIGG
jgi:hypothetical protein